MPESFSHTAGAYDRDFTHTTIGIKQRRQVHNAILSYLNKSSSVLELNGGTGEDALFLAKHCGSVLTTDISPEMVNVSKAKTAHLENVSTQVLDVNALDSNSDKKYDLLFSNFGGLNCLSPQELKIFMDNSESFLKLQGVLIAVIMGRKTIWERLYFWLKKDEANKKRRRSKEAIESNIDGELVSTWYYSPKEVESMAKGIRIIALKPIGLFVPPSYLQSFFNNKKVLLNIFHFMDGFFGRRWADYADHYCICFQKEE